MHTKTSKQVLAPLADAVSALIVIISDAEIHGSPTPNLSELSKAVDLQVANLLNVAAKITSAANADKKIKDDMPPACEEVKGASGLLVSSTQELVDDPISSVGRAHLLESVKGILSGTSHILDAFDESEVRRILAASSVLRQLLAQVKRGPTVIPGPEYVKFLTQTSQTIVLLAQFSSKRLGELLSKDLIAALQECIKALTTESPLLISVCKLVVKDPKSVDIKETLEGVCLRIENISLKIDEIVSCREENLPEKGHHQEHEVSAQYSRRQLADNLLSDSFGEAYKRDTDRTRENYERFMELSKESLRDIKVSLELISDPAIKTQVNDIAAKISIYTERLGEVLSLARLDPDDPKHNHDIRALVNAISEDFEIVNTLLNRGLVEELVSTLGTLTDVNRPGTLVHELNAAQKRGDAAAIADLSKQFELANQKLDRILKEVEVSLRDYKPQVAREVHAQASRVTDLAPAVQLATRILAANPTDALAAEYLNNVMTSYVNATKDVQKLLVTQDGVFAPNDLVNGSKSAFEQHAAALQAAIASQDRAAMEREYLETEMAAAQFLAFSEKEKEFSEDPGYKTELEIKLKSIQTALPMLLKRSQAILANKGAPESFEVDELERILSDLSLGLSAVGSSIVAYKGVKDEVMVVSEPAPYIELTSPSNESFNAVELTQEFFDNAEQKEMIEKALERGQDEGLRALTSAVTDVVVVNALAPRRLSDAEAESNPLKAAGQELKVEASYWNAEENELIAAVNEMSAQFLDLSTAHGQLSANHRDAAAKKAFIDAAKAIMIQANRLIKASSPLLEVCTDKRLRSALRSTLDRISTLAQQLKIVAAVKASAPSDSDKGTQLVTCAQNLMQSVKAALRDSISCTLRVRKDLPSSNAAIKFKKVIYAKDLLAAGFDFKKRK